MQLTRKVYAYITRERDGATEFLVFRHRDDPEAGVQVPRGTVEQAEDPRAAVLREAREETGLADFTSVRELASDTQTQPDGSVHERHFFQLSIAAAPDTWARTVVGAGDDSGLVFCCFWARSAEEVGLWPGFGDALHLILAECRRTAR